MNHIDTWRWAAIGEELRGDPLPQKAQEPPRWAAGNGRVIPVTQLEDGHLINILSYIERKHALTIAAWVLLGRELPDSVDPRYPYLLAEAVRRGLTTEHARRAHRLSLLVPALALVFGGWPFDAAMRRLRRLLALQVSSNQGFTSLEAHN